MQPVEHTSNQQLMLIEGPIPTYAPCSPLHIFGPERETTVIGVVALGSVLAKVFPKRVEVQLIVAEPIAGDAVEVPDFTSAPVNQMANRAAAVASEVKLTLPVYMTIIRAFALGDDLLLAIADNTLPGTRDSVAVCYRVFRLAYNGSYTRETQLAHLFLKEQTGGCAINLITHAEVAHVDNERNLTLHHNGCCVMSMSGDHPPLRRSPVQSNFQIFTPPNKTDTYVFYNATVSDSTDNRGMEEDELEE